MRVRQTDGENFGANLWGTATDGTMLHRCHAEWSPLSCPLYLIDRHQSCAVIKLIMHSYALTQCYQVKCQGQSEGNVRD